MPTQNRTILLYAFVFSLSRSCRKLALKPKEGNVLMATRRFLLLI